MRSHPYPPASHRGVEAEGVEVFQAEVRQTPQPLQGGAFRVDTEQVLHDFRTAFATLAIWPRS